MQHSPDEQLDGLLSAVHRVKPSTWFKVRLSTRLFIKACRIDIPGHVFAKTLSFATATLSIVVALGTSLFAYHSDTVYAGTPLYGLKRTIENIEVSLNANTPEETAEAHLKLAERRGDEIREIRSQVGNGYVKNEILEQTLQEYVGSTESALVAAKESANVHLQNKVARIARAEADELQVIQEALIPTAPGTTEPVNDPAVEESTPLTGSGTEITDTDSDELLVTPEAAMIKQAVDALDVIANEDTSAKTDETVVSDDRVPVAN